MVSPQTRKQKKENDHAFREKTWRSPPGSTVGTHGPGTSDKNKRKATVGVLVGRNLTLPRFLPQGAPV